MLKILIAVAIFIILTRVLQSRGAIPGSEARALVESGALLVDVRSETEFAHKHLDGALNIPLNQLEGRMAELGNKDREIVVYCQNGPRSSQASRFLQRQGFSRVHNLGAMRRWS